MAVGDSIGAVSSGALMCGGVGATRGRAGGTIGAFAGAGCSGSGGVMNVTATGIAALIASRIGAYCHNAVNSAT